MKQTDLVFILLGFMLGTVCYLSTNSYILSVLVLIVLEIDYLLLMRKKFKNCYSLIERVHTSYHFINSFVVSMSVKDSLEDAYESGIRIDNARLNEVTKELTEMPVIDRVKYLKSYFNLSIYKMFLNVLDLYQDQGGNILSMTDNLIRECTRTEKVLSDTLAIGYKHLSEFIVLWIMSFGILLFMRFSLVDFYQTMLKTPFIIYLLFSFFLICIASINLFVNAFTNLTIKEEEKE